MLQRGIEKNTHPSYLGVSGTGQVPLPAPGNEAATATRGINPGAVK